MQPDPEIHGTSRREREILDIVYARGEATAAEVRRGLSAPPSYSAVRGLLRVLEDKGHLQHRRVGSRNVYTPTRDPDVAGRSAMRRALETFFRGDVRLAVTALVEVSKHQMSSEDLRRLRAWIQAARKQGR